MSSSLAINHDGVIHSSVFIPTHKELPRISVASPKKESEHQKSEAYEKETWYVVADGIVISVRLN